ncbi:MAG: twin-arginine translocase subunit TatC [Aggregatilineales bacterium]
MATQITPPPDQTKLPRRRLRRIAPLAIRPTQGAEPQPDGQGAVMGFFEHIEELRMRLFRAILGLAVGIIISVVIANPVIAYLAASSGITLQAISPTETITVFFRVTLMMGGIFASPLITWQLLMFIIPGLTQKERRYVLLSIPAITLMFVFGVAVTWLILVPAYNSFLIGFQSNVIKASWTADNYFGFVTSVLFWHGVAFETPVVFFVLGKLGIVTARKMLHYWRHAAVASAAFAGFIAPTYDPLTMVVITSILFSLFLFSVVLVGVSGRRTPRTAAA